MRELGYERRLRSWAESRGHGFDRLSYPRPEAGGQTTAYRLMPAAPRGVLVLVHGTGNDALFALPGLIKEALARGLEVFAFDLDGHGRGSTTVMRRDAITSAVPAALEHARARRDLPLHLWGISLGGSLALHALGPGGGEGVSSAVIVSAPIRLEVTIRAALAELRWSGVRAAWRERSHATLWEMIPAFGPFKRSLYPVRLPRDGSTFGYIAEVSALIESLRLVERAPSVQAPVLLLYGARDRIVTLAQGEELVAHLPRARLLQVRGSHLTTFYGEDMAARCLDWMEDPRVE
jgi:alpha-beta hydrolase superfamily lysophospholipase